MGWKQREWGAAESAGGAGGAHSAEMAAEWSPGKQELVRSAGVAEAPGQRQQAHEPGSRSSGVGVPRGCRIGGIIPREVCEGPPPSRAPRPRRDSPPHRSAGLSGPQPRLPAARLCGLRWAAVEAEPRRRRRRCTAAFRFLSRRRPAARAQPCEPGAAASQELRALPAPPRARPTCSGGRGGQGPFTPPVPPPSQTLGEAHALTFARSPPLPHTHLTLHTCSREYMLTRCSSTPSWHLHTPQHTWSGIDPCPQHPSSSLTGRHIHTIPHKI